MFPIVTAVMCLWVLVSGRGFRGWPRWARGRRGRLLGAYGLLADLIVIALALTGQKGFAFVLFAVVALSTAGLSLIRLGPASTP